MIGTKFFPAILILSFLCSALNAQESDNNKAQIQKSINDKFSVTRTFDLQIDQYLPANFDSKLFGQDYQSGEVANYTKLRLTTNIPIIKKPKWTVTGTLRYKYNSLQFKKLENRINPDIPLHDYKDDFHYFSGTLSYTYFSKLFNKPFIVNGSLGYDASDKGSGRLKGIVGGTFVLKKTDRTRISLGAIVFIDPAAPIPAAPIFAVEHQFRNSAWTMDLILPQRLLFKRSLLKNGRISIGSELGGDNFYVSNTGFGSNSMYDFRQMELKTGITYEYAVKNLIFSFKGGMSNMFQDQLIEKGKLSKDYIFELNRKASGYFTFGVSYNPF